MFVDKKNTVDDMLVYKPNGMEFKIVSVDASSYHMEVTKTNGALPLGFICTDMFPVIDGNKDYVLIGHAGKPFVIPVVNVKAFKEVYSDWNVGNKEVKNIIQKECTCDSKVLFNRGCQCNAITKYKPKWG